MNLSCSVFRHSWMKGGAAILLSCVFYTAASVSVKLLSGTVDAVFISFVRFVIGIILSFSALRILRLSPAVRDLKWWLLRGSFGAASMIAAYVAIRMTSSGRAILLSDTYPVFVALFGVIFFKETMSRGNIFSIAVCFSGILLVLFDTAHYSFSGNLIGLASGILGGFAVHFIRRARVRNNSFVVYLSACFFGAAVTSFSIASAPAFSIYAWSMLCLIGFFAFSGQICMTWGYKHISAVRGSVVGLVEVPMTVMAGALIIGERISFRFVLGGIVILAGLLICYLGARKESSSN